MRYPFFKKGTLDRCYWCREEDEKELTRDHLPPINIFPKEERNGLPLIKALICNNCKKLHFRSGNDDYKFLCHMLLWKHLSSGSLTIDKKLEECLEKSFPRKDQLIAKADYLMVTLSSGRTVQYPILEQGRDAILRVLDCVARGFYYRMRGEIIPQYVSPSFEFKPKGYFDFPQNPLQFQNSVVVKKHVFEFKLVLADGDKSKYLCFEFKFYNLESLPIYYSYDLY